MEITKNTWQKTLLLEREFLRRGEEISRNKLQDGLLIPQAEAQFLIGALQNKDVIRCEPDRIDVSEERVVFFADAHFPFQDDLCLNAIIENSLIYNPTIICIVGDLLDFYKISRFIKNPSKKDVAQEIREGKQFLIKLRGLFPKARIILKEGNHESHLERYIIENAKEIHNLISDLLQIKLGLHELNIEYMTEPFAIGKLWILHGHEKPAGGNPEWICNVMWQYVYDHFMVAHFHRTQQKTFKDISGNMYWTGSLGYCAGKMDYAILNKWTHGFAKVDFISGGKFKAHNYEIIDGEIY